MEKHLPTHAENPNGLHQRYVVKKLVPTTEEEQRQEYEAKADAERRGLGGFLSGIPIKVKTYKEVEIDEGAEYFVMRLDTGGSDIEHIKACRIGIHAYAAAIESKLPVLANDLRLRYPLID